MAQQTTNEFMLGESYGQTAVNWLYYELQDQFQKEILGMDDSKFEAIFQKARQVEQQCLKEMYLKGIENYDPTFKRQQTIAHQTAVEWLIDRIVYQHKYDFMSFNQMQSEAKKMEKEQIEKAFNTEWSKEIRTGELYYNETYGK